MDGTHINLVDFDQVMFNTREALTRVYKQAFLVHGIDVSEEEWIINEGQSIDRVLDSLGIEQSIRNSIKEYKKKNYKFYFKYIIPNYEVIDLPNKVIVSNAHSRDIKMILSYYGITDVIGIVARNHVNCLKPAPDPYVLAIGNYSADTYTVFEDSDTGIDSATKAVELLNLKNRVAIIRVELDCVEMHGGSGQLLRRQNEYIDKITDSNHALLLLSESGVSTPKIRFSNNEKLIMSYVEGESLSNIYCHQEHFPKIVNLIEQIRRVPQYNENNTDSYVKRLEDHKKKFIDFIPLQKTFDFCIAGLAEYKSLFDQAKSFSHGDLTLSNMLYKDDEIIVIDPNYSDKIISSWLLDISKLLQSARGYEYMFRITNSYRRDDLIKLKEALYQYVDSSLHRLIAVLELSHWLRMLKYKKQKSEDEFNTAVCVVMEIEKEMSNCQIQLLS